jgi:hypothetical protein
MLPTVTSTSCYFGGVCGARSVDLWDDGCGAGDGDGVVVGDGDGVGVGDAAGIGV